MTLKNDIFRPECLAWHVMGTDPPAKIPPPQIGNPPSPKFLPPPQSSNFLLPLRLEMAASAFFTHGYFQQAHVHISEAIITD